MNASTPCPGLGGTQSGSQKPGPTLARVPKRRRSLPKTPPNQAAVLRQLVAAYEAANKVCPSKCKHCVLQTQTLGFCAFSRAYLMGQGYTEPEIQQLLTKEVPVQ